ncbi:hypothetical protein [Clostridium sp. UBA5119]
MKCRKMYVIALVAICIVCANMLYSSGTNLLDEKGPVDIGSTYNMLNL